MILDRALEIVRDRVNRRRMAQSDYWTGRVQNRKGDARTAWHNEVFNGPWYNRQVQLLDNALRILAGGVKDRDVLEVGCGTGRISQRLVSMGAKLVGVDFSFAALEAAAAGCAEVEGHEARLLLGDIAQPPLPVHDASIDVAVSVGCLAVACKDIDFLEHSLRELVRVTRPNGAVVLLEPIHSSILLSRVLRAPVSAWVDAASRAGLRLVVREEMGLVPVRLALSSFDLSESVVNRVFAAGEAALDDYLPRIVASYMSDYTLLGFRRPDR